VTRILWLSAGVAVAAAMSWFAGASLARSAAALVIVYLCGYVTGSLLVEPRPDRTTLSLGVVRALAGLLLTSIGFLLSLQSPLPWFSAPIALLAIAVHCHGRAACVPPRLDFSLRWDGAVAGLVAVILLIPPVISALRMAPGDFPPVFFHVDVPYFLEKVHALVGTQMFPPESLSVLDGRRAYHFGINGMAALISRGSGIAPHHAVFLLVVPLLKAGIVAAAVVLARGLAPSLPSLVAVPLLVISVPTFWYDFWAFVGPALRDAASSGSSGPLDSVTLGLEFWGVTANVQNMAGHFLVLASLAGIVHAPSAGWRLPVFLIGSAVIFKSPTGVALVGGFALAQAFRAVQTRSLQPLIPAAEAAAVFGVVYGVFWVLPPVPAEFRTELFPLFHLNYLRAHGGLIPFVMDAAWVFLPVLLVLSPRLEDREGRSLSLLFFAAAPFIVVNVTRLVYLRGDLGVSSLNEDDWRQIMIPVPLLIRAFVLSVAGQRWPRLGTGVRAVFLFVVLLAVGPQVFVAARYAHRLVVDPASGHEFVDNRSLAEALATIPTRDTIVVTNDLRYPADEFQRADRQMQIPALFGHQAFAVNYAYETYSFSRGRLALQALLQADQWTPAIQEAARANRWTHLLIHKDFEHPEPIPLERVFENESYSVYRFGT
jgi:hypothetical protein